MIKAILLDMDGTIVNSEKHYVDGTVEWITKKGYDFKRSDACKIIGLKEKETYEALSLMTGMPYEEIKECNEHYFNIENVLNYSNYVFPDTEPTLKELKQRGYHIAICSTSSTMLVERCIEQLGLKDYIDYYCCGDQVLNPKPDPEIYLKSLDKIKVKTSEAIVVEDSYNGILAAKRAGLYTCARRDTQFGIDQSQADIIIDSLIDIIKVIECLKK